MYFPFYNQSPCCTYINALPFVFLKEEAQISTQFKFGVSACEIGIGYSHSYQNHTLTV